MIKPSYKIRIFFIFLLFSIHSIFAYWPQLPDALIQEQKQYEERVRKSPSNLNLRFELAMHYAYTGWAEHAWNELKKIDETDKTFKTQKLLELKKSIQKNQNSWKSHFDLSFALFFNNQKKEALNSMLTAHQLNQENAFIMGFVGLLYGEKKDYDKTIKWAKRALKKEPYSTALHFLLAEAYLRKGDYFSFAGESIRVLAAKASEKKFAPQGP